MVNQFTIQGNRDDLREMLTARQAGGIIFTTVQKFSLLNSEQTHPVLNTRSNIVVISDEAHRSQYGLNKEVEEVIEDEEDIASRERTKSKWAALEKLVGAEPRLKEVAEDLVAHFEARTPCGATT